MTVDIQTFNSIMKFREAATADIEYLVNHPDIYPSTGFPEGCHADAEHFYDTEGNVAFLCIYGGMLFNNEGDGVFSGHFLFLPGTRGVDIMTAAKAMLIEMFTNRGASVIKGYPPRDNRAVRVIGTALGYRKLNKADFQDDFGRICETYEVRQKWLV